MNRPEGRTWGEPPLSGIVTTIKNIKIANALLKEATPDNATFYLDKYLSEVVEIIDVTTDSLAGYLRFCKDVTVDTAMEKDIRAIVRDAMKKSVDSLISNKVKEYREHIDGFFSYV